VTTLGATRLTDGTTGQATFDAGRRYELHPDLALRPERFGALLYHYGTRRLTFLKSLELTAIVSDIGEHPSVDAALTAHDVGADRRQHILRALAKLEASEVISVR
jgi:putative mycofactocin binding protein MftB